MAPDDVFPDGSRWRLRSLAFEMRDLRNELMHFAVFDREAQIRFFSTAWRLLDGLGLAAAAEARATLMCELVDEHPVREGSALASEASSDYGPLISAGAQLEDVTDDEDGGDDRVDLGVADILDEVPMRVDDLVWALYAIDVRIRGQMADALWVYQGISDVGCPECGTPLDVCRSGRYDGEPDHRAWAVVCTECGIARRKQVLPDDVRRALYQWGLRHPRQVGVVGDV